MSTQDDIEGVDAKRTENGPFKERRFVWYKFKTDVTSGELVRKDDNVLGIAMADTLKDEYSWIQTYGFHPSVDHNGDKMEIILKVA